MREQVHKGGLCSSEMKVGVEAGMPAGCSPVGGEAVGGGHCAGQSLVQATLPKRPPSLAAAHSPPSTMSARELAKSRPGESLLAPGRAAAQTTPAARRRQSVGTGPGRCCKPGAAAPGARCSAVRPAGRRAGALSSILATWAACRACGSAQSICEGLDSVMEQTSARQCSCAQMQPMQFGLPGVAATCTLSAAAPAFNRVHPRPQKAC